MPIPEAYKLISSALSLQPFERGTAWSGPSLRAGRLA